MAKPDNRADNLDHLQNAISDTIENLSEAEDYLDEHADEISPQDRQAIESKNDRRRQSIEGFKSEMQDEAAYQDQS
ncbi:small acid-soluble spore protein Tlp [Paenibacillus cremeus]|uniref:Small acid-soluble spore protein Tlp n=1 Tax=Paenibacillus cremeus TaxID=2163881 RepID=A0A559KDE3_9BACL|nr:small acid-soluble spore protein Tlp [Paenibacillus cremeus]TVY10135.1 small acid-soluble spore protein Tlp [Paenibacillus cremeus]